MREFLLFVLLACIALLSCSISPVAGGSTSTPNERISGFVVFPSGAPASRTIVQLIPSSYDAIENATSLLLTDTTDDSGAYSFSNFEIDTCNIQVVHIDTRERGLATGIITTAETVWAPSVVLEPAGNLLVIFSDSLDPPNGYLYIPGTTICKSLSGKQDTVLLDSVPAAMIPGLYYSAIDRSYKITLRNNIAVTSGDTAIVTNLNWKFSRRIYLNTSATGAAVSGNVIDFPVLIRLNGGNFPFGQAQAHGEDLRFAESDNTPLSYEIEEWDPVLEKAEIWVKVDTVLGNSSTQYITMYWGNSEASSLSNSVEVFDSTDGFVGVWHLGGEQNATAFDATANHFDGVPYGMTSTSGVDGIVSGARYFDGISSYIVMPNTANSSLSLPENGTYAISLWAYADTFDAKWHVIAGKGHEQYYLKLKCFSENRATWEFAGFQDKQGWAFIENLASTGTESRTWVNIVGIRDGTKQYLYINGNPVKDTVSLQPGNYSINTGDNFSIGGYLREVFIPYYEGYCYYKGKIDEVRVIDKVPDANWIKCSYMNQKLQDALVQFGQ